MKMTLMLRTESPVNSRQFYEIELGMFKLQGEMWDWAFSMSAIDNEAFSLEFTTYHRATSEVPIFRLTVKNCDREFARLRATTFTSGGRIVPNKRGVLEVFEYPAGKNFQMEDPAGNRFIIHEDYTVEENI